jgi:hypothetical protein
MYLYMHANFVITTLTQAKPPGPKPITGNSFIHIPLGRKSYCQQSLFSWPFVGCLCPVVLFSFQVMGGWIGHQCSCFRSNNDIGE